MCENRKCIFIYQTPDFLEGLYHAADECGVVCYLGVPQEVIHHMHKRFSGGALKPVHGVLKLCVLHELPYLWAIENAGFQLLKVVEAPPILVQSARKLFH